MHEAIARLWENNIGKSLPFWEGQYPDFKENFTKETRNLELHDFVDYINEPSNTPIRIHADEISYVFHIYIRYLIEKKLIEGSLKVSDVPELWNSLMKEYLDINISNNDAEGCLQDVHWACGLIGYFPTYIIGSIYASQIHHKMKTDITDFDDLLRNSQFEPINEWLRSNIYRHGARYSSPEIMERITGSKSLDFTHFINYLNEKYSS
jgi:carboxypeptidase Taq